MRSQFINSRKFGLVVCGCIVLLWFSPWWLCGKNLAPLDIMHQMMQPWRGSNTEISVNNHFVADAVDQYLVYRMVAADSYKKEGWLGWSSLTYGGTPQYANTMALYYDWTMQLHRWFNFWTAWHLGIMAQVFIASSGMLFFLRNRNISSLWSCCGAIAYSSNSQFVTWIYHRWALGSFCWVPWIYWAIDSYRNGKLCSWSLVPLFIALAFLGGTLQHAAFIFLCVASMALEEIWNGNFKFEVSKSTIARYLIWGVLGTGIAAMMFVPCIDSYLISNRLGLHTGTYGNANSSVYPQGLTQPLLNFASYPLQIFPSIFGRCDTIDLLKTFKSDLFYVAYFGSLPVLIALLAVFKKNVPTIARILISFGLLLPLTPLVRFLYQRLFLLFVLGGILAFVDYMQNSSRESKQKLSAITTITVIFIVTTWTFISLLIYTFQYKLVGILEKKFLDASAGSSFGYFREWMQHRLYSIIADSCIWSTHQLIPLLLLILALLGLKMSSSYSHQQQKIGSILIATVVVLEVSLFASRWVTFTDPSRYPLYPTTPEIVSISKIIGDGTTATLQCKGSGHMANTPFISNTLSPYGIKSITGYDSIVPSGMNVDFMKYSKLSNIEFTGVTHLFTDPQSIPNVGLWDLVYSSPVFHLYENRNCIKKYTGFKNKEQLDLFLNRDPRYECIALSEIFKLENKRSLIVPASVKFIRISENYSDGWQYRVMSLKYSDWKPVSRAIDASMFLALENQDHTKSMKLEMRYDPPNRKIGFIVSLCCLLLTTAAGSSVYSHKH